MYVVVLIGSNVAALLLAIKVGVTGALIEYQAYLEALAEEIREAFQVHYHDAGEVTK